MPTGKCQKMVLVIGRREFSFFSDLVDKFIKRFALSRLIARTSTSLMYLQQQSQESLRSYLSRFTEESLQIAELDDQVTIAAFINGLQPGMQ